MTVWEQKRLLVWGTTYPEFSKKYYETVCSGAIDRDSGRLRRIYPITLRYMKEPFHAFDWIEAKVERNMSDFRPESYRIDQGSIKTVGHIDTNKNGWAERAEWMLRPGNVFRSVAALREAQGADHTSLGLIKPKEVLRFYLRPRPVSDKAEWETHREAAIAQKDLLVDVDAATKDLKYMPIQYRAEFICGDPACSTKHDMSVLDWGTYVLSRKEYARGGAPLAEKNVIAALTKRMDLTKRNAHFILGNTKAHPDAFMVVGFFAPPISAAQKPSTQIPLF